LNAASNIEDQDGDSSDEEAVSAFRAKTAGAESTSSVITLPNLKTDADKAADKAEVDRKDAAANVSADAVQQGSPAITGAAMVNKAAGKFFTPGTVLLHHLFV
jgi:hypothetical protein